MLKIKRIISDIVHLVTRIFCIFPIDKRKIVFESYMGKQYSCNPKYICEYIDSKDDYELIWIYHKTKLPCKYKQVKRNSLLYFYYMLTAGTIIINSGKNKLIEHRRNQILINTWHGGGAYKRVDVAENERYRKNDYFLSSCQMCRPAKKSQPQKQ